MIKILVVIKDINSRKLMLVCLKQNGFETYGADNFTAALTLMDKHKVNLILVDLLGTLMNMI